jgi:hypothetical protein
VPIVRAEERPPDFARRTNHIPLIQHRAKIQLLCTASSSTMSALLFFSTLLPRLPSVSPPSCHYFRPTLVARPPCIRPPLGLLPCPRSLVGERLAYFCSRNPAINLRKFSFPAFPSHHSPPHWMLHYPHILTLHVVIYPPTQARPLGK